MNVSIELPAFVGPRQQKSADLGIDLGLKDFAGFSNDSLSNVEAQRFYRDMEPKLAVAQRAGKKARVKAIHAKIANRRKDFQHQLSTALVKQYGAIFVGNVNASALAKTTMAKSVLDAGWSQFRNTLRHRCAYAEVHFEEIDERFSTQTCGVCKSRTGPQGREGLGIREWTCPECGSAHQRDRNAARNILAAGRRRLAVVITVSQRGLGPLGRGGRQRANLTCPDKLALPNEVRNGWIVAKLSLESIQRVLNNTGGEPCRRERLFFSLSLVNRGVTTHNQFVDDRFMAESKLSNPKGVVNEQNTTDRRTGCRYRCFKSGCRQVRRRPGCDHHQDRG